MASCGIALTPFDLLLQSAERREYARSGRPRCSILLVCGPPRSGTTLVAQYLINCFNVSYLNNLSSLFPRSPITANRWIGRFAPLQPGDYEAYYGKSRGLSGANDALYVWDRWLGADRRVVPRSLVPGSDRAIAQFFGALESLYGLPVINKVNRLNTCANLIAASLESSVFLCLQRDPLMLAQSLYLARTEITGDIDKAYGLSGKTVTGADAIEDVCQQVLFHENHARIQQQLVGERRFSIISYEDFCRRPAALAASIARDCNQLVYRDRRPREDCVFHVSDREKLPPQVLDRMRSRLAELGAGRLNCRNF